MGPVTAAQLLNLSDFAVCFCTVQDAIGAEAMPQHWKVAFSEIKKQCFLCVVRFPCGRWLGKGVGDGSLERVLIGHLVSPGGEEDAGRLTGTPPELASPSQSVRNVLGSLGRSSTYPLTEHSSTQ